MHLFDADGTLCGVLEVLLLFLEEEEFGAMVFSSMLGTGSTPINLKKSFLTMALNSNRSCGDWHQQFSINSLNLGGTSLGMSGRRPDITFIPFAHVN